MPIVNLFRSRLALAALIGALAFASAPHTAAQTAASHAEAEHNHILLVLPFDNRSGQPSLEWVREAAAQILSARFSSVGLAPMTRADRLYALDHLGLPQGFQPSRASSLKLAQTLDADAIIVGSFLTDGTDIVAEARIVNVGHLDMTEPVTARGNLKQMADVFDVLAWKLTRQFAPESGVAQETFLAAGRNLRMDAFEQYIRGIVEPDQSERLHHLEQSVALNPGFAPAWMALGREQYAAQKFEEAANAYQHVTGTDADALEASFYRGISLLFTGNYTQAEAAFSSVAKRMPLAEVLNNQGVAVSRRNADATDLFRHAVAAEPTVADYHFNLAVALKRHGQSAEALAELGQCLKLHPNDGEAQNLQAAWRQPMAEAPEPLERIARNYNAVAFRQAASMLEQMENQSLAELSPNERAHRLASQASEYLGHGLLLEAERICIEAVAADNHSAEAHAVLAGIREQAGDLNGARTEARNSLELLPTAPAYLVLARLDLNANHLDLASTEVREALALDPSSAEAHALAERINRAQK